MSAFPPSLEGTHHEPVEDRRTFAVTLAAIGASFVLVYAVRGAVGTAVFFGVLAAFFLFLARRRPARTLRLDADGIHRQRRLWRDETTRWSEVVAVDGPNRWRDATRLRRRVQAPIDVEGVSADDALALKEWLAPL